MIFLHNLSLFQMNSVPLHSLSKRKLVHTTIGEMVEWSITTVLKTVVPRGTGGSNPSLSALLICLKNVKLRQNSKTIQIL